MKRRQFLASTAAGVASAILGSRTSRAIPPLLERPALEYAIDLGTTPPTVSVWMWVEDNATPVLQQILFKLERQPFSFLVEPPGQIVATIRPEDIAERAMLELLGPGPGAPAG